MNYFNTVFDFMKNNMFFIFIILFLTGIILTLLALGTKFSGESKQ